MEQMIKIIENMIRAVMIPIILIAGIIAIGSIFIDTAMPILGFLYEYGVSIFLVFIAILSIICVKILK